MTHTDFQALLDAAYINHDTSAQETLQERYTYGHCMDLAIAFHRLYGYEIQATITTDPDKTWIAHAWATTQDGRFLDVMGDYTDTIELASFGDKVITNLDEAGLNRFMDTPPEENDIQLAQALAKRIMHSLKT